MVQLREIPRSGVFAWSPGTDAPFVVTGTRAGAVDADFSDESALELWDLALDSDPGELQPLHSVRTEARFYDIAWAPADDDHPRGVIAGALENGTLVLWDAEKLAAGEADAVIETATKHGGAIRTLQFNPLKPQILATGGAKGELFIYNIGDLQNPFRLGHAAASRADDIAALAWNKKVSHILATGGAGGQVTVWDVKTKKASLTLSNNRKSVSAVAWDPTNSTRLVTASPDDGTPVIYVWNLRQSNAPERTLAGHEAGVLSLAWCVQDPSLLLSCGKDNRTLVWNPHTGESYGTLQEGTNWAFQTGFHPANPNLTATASFDGKVSIQTLQNTNTGAAADAAAAATNNLDGEDFFASAHAAPQVVSFSLPTPPTWYRKPVGAVFGFGGKLAYFTTTETEGKPATSTVHITTFVADEAIVPATETFEEALKAGDLHKICATHAVQAKTDAEREDWEVMETLVDANPRQQVITRLGFAKDPEKPKADEVDEADKAATDDKADGKTADAEETAAKTKKADGADEDDFFGNGDGDAAKKDADDFFGDSAGDDDFLGGADAAQDDTASNASTPASPFRLLGQGNTTLEDTITRALVLGDFSRAVDICLSENRMADAFVVANCGGKALVEKVQGAYLAAASPGAPSYLRLLNSVLRADLWDVVRHADLANWKETLATLCTFATPEAFPAYCEALGDRILEVDGETSADKLAARKNAAFCYLVGSRLEKVVPIWISELDEAAGGLAGDAAFARRAEALQAFIEKVTVFRQVTQFADPAFSSSSGDGWKLAALYDKYLEFADLVASSGLLFVAAKYLKLVPAAYKPAADARDRVEHAVAKATAKPVKTTARGLSRTSFSGFVPAGSPVAAPAAAVAAPAMHPYATTAAARSTPVSANPYAPPAANPYAPAGSAPAANPYAPPGAAAANPYAPAANVANPYAPAGVGAAAATPSYGAPPAFGAPPYGAPPRQSSASAGPPRASFQKDAGSWNDVPIVTRAPVRRSTPIVAPITAPFGSHQTLAGPPPASPAGITSPPPRGPPRMSSPLVGGPPMGPPTGLAGPHAGAGFQPPPRPSSAANAYAPPPSAAPAAQIPTRPPPRTESPYNAPPGGAPPTSRYAPAPASQTPSAGGPPPPQRYAPPQGAAPPTQGLQRPPQGPPHGPPQGPPHGPPRAPPRSSVAGSPVPAAASPVAAAPPKARHPAGDRSHIPPEAQRLVQILSGDLQRVASKAPPAFAAQVKDTTKRLHLLFDHLNNGELVQPATVAKLSELAEALEGKAYENAQRLQIEIHREKAEECGNWMVGVKRLIAMSKATP